jgi:hypothetical protein
MWTDSLEKTFGEVFIDFLCIWCTFQAISARLGAFATENYFSKRKPK